MSLKDYDEYHGGLVYNPIHDDPAQNMDEEELKIYLEAIEKRAERKKKRSENNNGYNQKAAG